MKLVAHRNLAGAAAPVGIGVARRPANDVAYETMSSSHMLSVLRQGAAPAPEALVLPAESAAVLETLIQTAVIPGLTRRHVAGGRPRTPKAPVADPYATELARLLMAHDPKAGLALILRRHNGARSILPLYATLFEPAARALGDLWAEDLCSEPDVTIALSRLQTAIRILGTQKPAGVAAETFPMRASTPAVLVVPEPGEMHALGAALDSDTLHRAGWSPQSEFPTTDRALQELLHTTWFDALDLSLSTVFNREHWLPRMSETIRRARRASLNPGLLVIVGGRIFTEQRDAAQRIGADAFSITALQVRPLIQAGLGRTRDNW